jgi:AcrR family transcriptional regulator
MEGPSRQERAARARAGWTKRARTRSALLRAAQAAFTEHGWTGTRIENVARLAGVSPATAYNHFPSKYVLIGHVYADVMAPLIRAAERHRTAEGPACQAFAEHLHQLAAAARREQRLTAAFACAVQEYTARVARPPSPYDDCDPRTLVPVPHGLTVLIDTAQRQGELDRHREPGDLAEQITFLLFLRSFTHPDESPHDTAEMLLRIILVFCGRSYSPRTGSDRRRTWAHTLTERQES